MVRGKSQSSTSKGSTGKRNVSSASRAAASPSPAPSSAKPVSKASNAYSAPSCCGCGSVITDDSKALQCDRCNAANSWKCIDCLNISTSVYDTLISNPLPVLRWFCDSCDQTVMNTKVISCSPQTDKLDNLICLVEKLMHRYETFENQIADKCDSAELAKLETRIHQLEAKFEQRNHDVDSRMQSLAVDCANAKEDGPTDEDLIKSVVHEELSKKTVDSRDAEYRKNNLIVYRVPEKKPKMYRKGKTMTCHL